MESWIWLSPFLSFHSEVDNVPPTVVRGFHTSEQIFAAKRRSEKSGCTSGDTDKPIATPGSWHYHTVKIDRLEGLEQFCGIMEELMLYSISFCIS